MQNTNETITRQTPFEELPELLRPKEVRSFTDVGRNAVYEAIKSGELPYRKIGVRATLENDVFRIHGTIREDGKEYLVKRGFFSGVDVINQSKDNRVGFKDMLKRIKRISSSKGGPIVK